MTRHFLVTGPNSNLAGFHALVCIFACDHHRRENTVSYTCFDENVHAFLHAATLSDVTLQETVTNRRHEEHPVLHLGSHGLKWERTQ
jgi:hypothetical protein